MCWLRTHPPADTDPHNFFAQTDSSSTAHKKLWMQADADAIPSVFLARIEKKFLQVPRDPKNL